MKKTVYSAAQPSGQLHIGNYCGAIKNWVQFQQDYDCSFCIVDSHAITVDYDPSALKENILNNAALYLAAGLDPEKSNIYVQSAVPQHTELAWMFTCVTPLSWLEKMTQYKSKSEGRESVGTGLLSYPVLMAADILLYDTDIVPVGDDQKQHVELTRDIAERFNSKFGCTFTVPDTHIPTTGARIMSLADPTKKMSKSDVDQMGAVYLLDNPDLIRKKIGRAKTDSVSSFDPETTEPSLINLVSIHGAFTGQSEEVVRQHFSGKGYGAIKKDVSEAVIEVLVPIQTRYAEYRSNMQFLQSVLNQSAEIMREKAERKLIDASQKMGLYRGYSNQ